AVTTVSDDWGQIGDGINGALKELLKGDHYGALAMAFYGEHGDLFMEQYLADHPEWLQAQIEKANAARQQQSAADYDDYADSQGQQGEPLPMSAREQELTNRLAEVEGRLNEINRAGQQTTEQKFRAGLEKQVFGTVVDKTFAQLEGWDQAELQQVMRM